MCLAFRTFQSWTAMSDIAHGRGVLHTVPIPEAMRYLMLRLHERSWPDRFGPSELNDTERRGLGLA
jgi:hypothetical protein